MTIQPDDVPTNLFERSKWIITQLRLQGFTLSKLAEESSVHVQTLSLALRSPHARAEEVIAEALGTEPAVLFPDRFTPTGIRIYGRRDRKPSVRTPERVRRVAAQR